MNPTLQGYAAAVLESTPRDEAGALADDLRAVDQLFASNPSLRAALTDTAVAPGARREVLRDLLDGKVSPPARRVASFAAQAVPAPDVPAAETWLAARARRLAEGLPQEEPSLSHLEARERVGGYAAAVFEDLSVAELEEVEDELFRFTRTVAANPALRAALVDRDLPVEVRQGLADDLLGGKVQPATLRLVRFTIVGGRARDVVGTLDWLVEETARARGWRVARVRAAAEVEGGERERLVQSLSTLSGSPVELQVLVDPSLLAGVVVEIGDLQVDATARGRLDQLREHMVAGGWEDRGLGHTASGGRRRDGSSGRTTPGGAGRTTHTEGEEAG